ncbi:MAG: hypothetical protein AAGH19_00970 [Pseudomonadota bacterium]
MKWRLFLPVLLAAFAATHVHAQGGATNKDGSIVTGVLTAVFDPNAGLEAVPVPNNLFYLGTTDLTLNAPSTGLDPTAAALVEQINTLDGFSTIERWTTSFSSEDSTGRPIATIDPDSVIPGQSVRVFQVQSQSFVIVTGIIRELVPGVDYVTAVQGDVLAIVPLQPLDEYSSYMAVLTNDITDTLGNNATPDLTYFLSQAEDSWVDENGNSTYPLIPDSTAQAVAALQPITASMEAVAESAGIPREDIILAWTVQTQSITPVLGLLRSTVQASDVTVGPAVGSTADLGIGLPGLADFHLGVITLPYYSGIPRAENPIAPLNEFWTAEPGAYIPPFDQLGLDPTSTNITVANPFPVLTGMETVPVVVTVPNENSGMTRPPGGWPVVIYGHGLGGNRMTALLVADALAAAGYVVVAIDFPLHGIEPWNPVFGPFYVGNTPFAPIARERTFDVDYVNNETGAPGPDGVVDASGTHALNFQEYRASRDNVRQGIIDMSVLAASLGNFDLDGDGAGDLLPFNVGYTSISWGGINGTGFAAIEPLITRSHLNVPAGGLVRAGEASPTFGPRIRAGLEAADIFPGDPLFELYLTVGQTVVDSADPINWISAAAQAKPILLHEVIGDTVLPNFVPGAPLSGTEPMIRITPLEAFSTTQANPEGLRVASRFVPPATHGSYISPASSPEATIEMQTQMLSFIASEGTLVQVNDEATMVPVTVPFIIQAPSLEDDTGANARGKRPSLKPIPGPLNPANFD